MPSNPRWLILVVVVAVGVSIRIRPLDQDSLWLDELITLTQTTGKYHVMDRLLPPNQARPAVHFTHLADAEPWWSIWPLQAIDAHPPLYLIMLRLWRQFVGEDALAARLLSVLASAGAILLAAHVGGMLYGRPLGLWCAALAAIAATQIIFAREARPYALLVLIGLASCAVILRIQQSGPSRWSVAALALLALVMPLVHYFAAGGLVALWLYAILIMRGPGRRAALGALAGGAALFLLTWGPFLWQQRHNTHYPFLIETAPGHLERTIERVALLPVQLLSGCPDEDYSTWVSVAGGALFCLTLIGTLLAVRRRELVLPALWFWSSVCVLVTLDLVRSTAHLHWIRYALPASPGLLLLLPAITKGVSWLRHTVPATLVLLCAIALPDLRRPVAGDWRGLGEHLRQHMSAQELLVMVPGEETSKRPDWLVPARSDGAVAGACLSHYAYSPGWSAMQVTRPIPEAVMQALRQRGGFWVIAFRPADLAGLFPGWIAHPQSVRHIPWVGIVARMSPISRLPHPALPDHSTPDGPAGTDRP